MTSWWWLSFCDTAAVRGERLVGACLVEAADADAAVERSNRLGINPGGDLVTIEMPADVLDRWPPCWRDRLITRAELAAHSERAARVSAAGLS